MGRQGCEAGAYGNPSRLIPGSDANAKIWGGGVHAAALFFKRSKGRTGAMTKADEMPITVNKTINVWSVVPTLLGMIITAFGWGVTYNSMTTADATAKASIENVASDVKEISAQLPRLQYDMVRQIEASAENKAGIVEANKRIDRVVESFGGTLDAIKDSVNKIATRVEVISTQIGDKPQRTRFPELRK